MPIAHVLDGEGLLVVNANVPMKSVPELIAHAKSQPGKLSYASGGMGTTSHLAGELFKSMAGVDIVHVPYKGNAPAITDVLGGQVQMIFATMPTVLPHVKGGRLRALAVLGPARTPAIEVPSTSRPSGRRRSARRASRRSKSGAVSRRAAPAARRAPSGDVSP